MMMKKKKKLLEPLEYFFKLNLIELNKIFKTKKKKKKKFFFFILNFHHHHNFFVIGFCVVVVVVVKINISFIWSSRAPNKTIYWVTA